MWKIGSPEKMWKIGSPDHLPLANMIFCKHISMKTISPHPCSTVLQLVLFTCIVQLYYSDGEIYSGAELTSWTFQAKIYMEFYIIAPFMEFLHLNWYIAEWLYSILIKLYETVENSYVVHWSYQHFINIEYPPGQAV